MGRKTTPFKLTRIAEFSSSPAVRAYVRKLLASGLYGTTEGQVLERLVCRQLEALIASGSLERRADLPLPSETEVAQSP